MNSEHDRDGVSMGWPYGAKVSTHPEPNGSEKSARRGCGSKAMESALGAVLVGLLFTQSIHAQFMVQPMVYEISAVPRERIRTEIVLQNMGRDETKYVRVSVVELLQTESGTWNAIDPNDPLDAAQVIDLGEHRSCRDWIRLADLPNNGLVEVPIMDRNLIPVNITVPAAVRGFYTAAIVASLEARPDQTGVVVRYEFIVPVLITIAGGALPKRISLVDAGLEYVPANGTAPETTLVTVGVKNTGGTYGQIVGVAQLIQLLKDDKTRLVKKNIVFDTVGIIPGSRLKLAEDIYKNLPTGTYRIKASLYVDGRLSRSISRVVNYVGPGGSGGLARREAAIRLEPPQVEMEIAPGRAASAVVTVFNNADEPVTIKSYALVPEALANKALGTGEKLDDLSCAEWLSIKPSELVVRAFSKRNLRLFLRMPDRRRLPQWGYDPGAYYANLRLYGFYGDDSLAGVINAHVCVKDKTVQATANVAKRGLKIEATGDSKFDVVATFENQSLIHIEPTCMVALYLLDGGAGAGEQVSYDRLQNGQQGDAIMLPFERRVFSRELDFSRRIPGTYRVEASFILGGNAVPVVQTKTIEIFIRQDGVERAVLFPQR